MKKIITFAAISLFSLLFFACGSKSDKPNFVGCWQGEANMIFEVLTENGTDYTIRNVNGDLSAQIVNDTLRGKNSLDMEYTMSVKGDSAYYNFGSITTGYKRISDSEYRKLFDAQKKAASEI
ncbi:MAG: hypothetical protein MJY99_10485 [Fibrobacter sp.]|uniref:hypothetical protein n=1 Tax=Fibrobacter sp. TaxID=35828 RepID=UPI00388F763D|nr:hypothetical protein [Fibrobacter sp.]